MSYHAYAMLMFYAAVNGPATFKERFGHWEQAIIQPSAPITYPKSAQLGIRVRSKLAKPPINILKGCACKGKEHA